MKNQDTSFFCVISMFCMEIAFLVLGAIIAFKSYQTFNNSGATKDFATGLIIVCAVAIIILFFILATIGLIFTAENNGEMFPTLKLINIFMILALVVAYVIGNLASLGYDSINDVMKIVYSEVWLKVIVYLAIALTINFFIIDSISFTEEISQDSVSVAPLGYYEGENHDDINKNQLEDESQELKTESIGLKNRKATKKTDN